MHRHASQLNEESDGILTPATCSNADASMAPKIIVCTDEDGPRSFASKQQSDFLIIAFGELEVSVMTKGPLIGECLLIQANFESDEVVVSGNYMMIDVSGPSHSEYLGLHADCGSNETVLCQKSPCLYLLGLAAKRHLYLEDFDVGEYAQAIAVVGRAEFSEQNLTKDSGLVSELPHWKLRVVDSYIKENIDCTILLEDLAEKCQMSLGYFSRLFKSRTGSTPHQYILEKRVEVACEMLTKSSLSICEIAYCSGFSSQSHMTAIFKKLIGITPKCYRAEQISFSTISSATNPRSFEASL